MIARIAVLAAAATLLAGCTPPSGTSAASATSTSTATAPAPLATLASFTQADLGVAIKMAQAATPPDTEAVACFAYLTANLANLQGHVTSVTPPVGAFSAFEAANLALGAAGGVISPAARIALETACGPLAAHVVNAGTSLATEIARLLGQVGIHVAVP